MGNYSRNKNFIPRKYINNQDIKKNKGSKRGVVVLVVINLIGLPLSVDTLFKSKEVDVKEVYKVEDTGIPIGGVIKWIEEIDVEVLSMDIKNNTGTMKVRSMQKIYDLEEGSDVVINNINSTDVNNYILQLTRKN